MIGRKKTRIVEEDTTPKGFDDFDMRLGDLMRGERATLGKSLLDVQRELKIKASYISAIENADPSVFETPGFIAGYVRSYARYLNMDPDKTFALFCTESGFATAHGMSAAASSIKTARANEGVIAGAVISGAVRDPIAQPSTPFAPTNDSIFSRVEPGAIGSSLVLVTLLGAIGFGGWTVLNEVQRVRVAPVDQTPIVLSDLDPVTAASPRSSSAPTTSAAVLSSDNLDRLYRPKALDAPVLEARDQPISMLDARSSGVFASAAPVQTDIAPNVGNVSTAEAVQIALETALAVPQVFEQKPDQVQLVAVRPAWVRVKAADGTVVFSGILDAGDTYAIPMLEDAPNLRVGESGAIYFALNGQTYGPAGPRGQVSSNVALSAEAVTQAYSVADMTQDQDLARMVAELQALPAVSE